MLVNEIKKWVDNEEEWFTDFLLEMTESEKYGDELDNYDDIEFDDKAIWMTYSYSTRCGDNDYYHANIPVEDVVRKLRKEKLEIIKTFKNKEKI